MLCRDKSDWFVADNLPFQVLPPPFQTLFMGSLSERCVRNMLENIHSGMSGYGKQGEMTMIVKKKTDGPGSFALTFEEIWWNSRKKKMTSFLQHKDGPTYSDPCVPEQYMSQHFTKVIFLFLVTNKKWWCRTYIYIFKKCVFIHPLSSSFCVEGYYHHLSQLLDGETKNKMQYSLKEKILPLETAFLIRKAHALLSLLPLLVIMIYQQPISHAISL